MWIEIVNWWNTLWTDPKPLAGAVAGFVSAFLMFLIKDAIWQRRVTRMQKRDEFRQKQLDSFYTPIYRFYREAYSRFYAWRKENPHTQLPPQPFFDQNDSEVFVEKLFAVSPSYASQQLIRLWSDFKAVDEKFEKNKRREMLISVLIREYHALRRKLDLDYDKDELTYGTFIITKEKSI